MAEPSKELLKASAESDRDLEDLLGRLEYFFEQAPLARETAINEGDIEGAKKIENAIKSATETLGMLQYHPFNSRFGPDKLVPAQRHDIRSDAGKYAPRGSQGHLLGYLAKHLGVLHDQRTHGNRGGPLADVIQKQGGVTYNPVRTKSREAPTRGYALSLSKNTEEVIEGPVDSMALRARLKNYVRHHWNEIKSKNNYLGGWRDDTTGKIYLDVSTVVEDLEQAKELARKAQQLAIYDLEKNETLDLAA